MIRKFIFFFLLAFVIQVQVEAQVNASFTAQYQYGCPPLVDAFTDNSTGNPTNYYWDFDNGNTSISQNATASFSLPGIYNVLHVVWNDPAFKDSIYMQIKVFQPPTDSFTSYDNVGCNDPCHLVHFINLTVPGESPIAKYVWDYGDGSNSEITYNATHCYNAQGNYKVTLVTIDSNGCQTSKIIPNFVVIKTAPNVSSTANPIQSCSVPIIITFTGNGVSPNGSVHYEQFYGDGGISALPNTTHNYTSGGIYNAFLVAIDSLGCVDTAFTPVALTDIQAGFTASTVNACQGGPITFTDTSNFASSWKWYFGDGDSSSLQNPAHIYATTGNFSVTLKVSFNGCTGTHTQTNYIHVSAPISFTFSANDTSNCSAPFTVNFTNNATGASSFLWNFGDSATATISNPNHTYNAPGSYTVSLTVGNALGCLNTKTIQSYIVIGGIHAAFTVDSVQGCSPFTVIFTNTSTSNVPITSYQWTFGDGGTSNQANPTHTYQVNGNYTPVLIIKNADGCIDTFSTPVIKVGSTLNPEFIAAPLTQCVDQPVNFTNQTQGTTNNTQYLWNFGDGQTSTLKNPVHAFSDTGTYNITLTVINQGCSKDTERLKYILIIVPKANFGYQFTCNNPTSVTFTDSSKGAQTWFWKFGDGTTSNVQNPPVHTYPHQGPYIVTLIVTNATTGCVDSMKQTVQVGTPVAQFGANITSGCAPLTVHFADSSQFATHWVWNFGDSTATSALQNPNHQYTKSGQYTVTLIIGSGLGCVDTFIKVNYITVYGIKAHINDGPHVGCTPYAINFIDSSTSVLANDVAFAWKWTFGTGDTSNNKNPSYIFSNNGSYTVTLKVTDSHGCTATATTPVKAVTPIAGFISDTALCPGELAHFTNQSQNSTAYQWNFGDGTATNSGVNPIHAYAVTGDYTVQLIAIYNTGNLNCRDTVIQTNHINVDTPEVDFVTDTTFQPCPPYPALFVNKTTRPGLKWLWYFGDGDTSTSQNPIHIYFFPGNYTVTLVGIDTSGCHGSKTYIDEIRIRGPIGHFIATPDTGCTPLTVSITGTEQSTVSTIADMGDGTTFTDSINIVHTYTQPSTYYPIYTLTDSLGCRVQYPVDTIVVGLIPYPNLPPDTTVCKGNYVAFNLPYGDHFQWTASLSPDSLTCDTCKNTLSKTRDTITYYVVATTNIGCVAKDTITVNVDALPHIFPGVEYRICPSDTLQLHASQDATVVSAVWTPDIYISDTNSVNPTVWPPDTVIYRVTGSNDKGCSISRIVMVWPITKVVANLLPYDTLVCGGTPVALLINVEQASYIDTFFTWLPSTYLSANNIFDPVISPPPGDYNYTVIVGSTGCEPDTNLIHLVVVPNPDITAGPDTTIATGTSMRLYSQSHQQPVTFTWTPTVDPLSCTTCSRPYVTVNQPQTVYVKVTDAYGCIANDSVVLNVVSCDAKMIFVPNTFTPNGDGQNDKLFVRGVGLRNLEYFRVFDRWGKLMWETHNGNEGWDGTLSGRPAEVATYVYELKATCTNGAITESSGSVTLIR